MIIRSLGESHRGRQSALAALVLLAIAAQGMAQTQAVTDPVALETVTIVASGVSDMTAASAGDVDRQQLSEQPLLRPGALLENVPGLIVTQHSGEGKANQYFLRAFNLDHGTDLATEIEDMPVNMPTHAHGQGYSDLNFLIPELVSDLHYKKGPYYADQGDFATAGAVRMSLPDQTDTRASLGYGVNGYRRALAMGSVPLASGTLLVAAEAYHNDGPFVVPDDYNRLNAVLSYHQGTAEDYWTLTGMTYTGQWNSTDQVPQRATDEGLISRFGSLNSTDGGTSSRFSVSFNRGVDTDSGQTQISAYLIRYKLDLWSTFTDFLKDPIYGDQMLQHDDRVVYGVKASKSWDSELAELPWHTEVGLQSRVDDIRDVAIHPTDERQIIGTTQDAGVLESNAAFYAESTLRWREWLRSVVSLREDAFDFDVHDKMVAANGSCSVTSDPLGCDSGSKRASIFSPKLGLAFGPWAHTSYYVKIGDGYHSNDARGVTRSGQNPDDLPVTPLTRALGFEVGLTSTPVPQWQTSLDLYELKLRSELVFDGDAGVTTPSGATTRRGVEWGNRYRLTPWLSAKLDAAFSHGRFDHNVAADDLGCSDAAPTHPCTTPIAITGRYIPNSPTNVIDAGLTVDHLGGWFASLRARHFGSSPLVEDDSARSPPYTTIDSQLGYRSERHWSATLDIFNLFNTDWNDIEYYYVSRLQGEAAPQPGYVVHPGVPRTLRAQLTFAI